MGHQFVPEGEGVGSHGVISTTVTQSVPEDVKAKAWGTSLCLMGGGGGRQSWGSQCDCHLQCPGGCRS